MVGNLVISLRRRRRANGVAPCGYILGCMGRIGGFDKLHAVLIAVAGAFAILGGARTRSERWSDRSKLVGIYGVVAAAAFVAGTPYALLDWRTFLTAMSEVTTHLRDGHIALAGPGWIIYLTSSLLVKAGL